MGRTGCPFFRRVEQKRIFGVIFARRQKYVFSSQQGQDENATFISSDMPTKVGRLKTKIAKTFGFMAVLALFSYWLLDFFWTSALKKKNCPPVGTIDFSI